MLRELARRSHDGLLVRLVWDSGRDQVVLRYRDSRGDHSFAVVVPSKDALQAFEHPNVYRPSTA